MIIVHLHCGVGTFATRTGVKTLGWLQKTSTVLFKIVCLKTFTLHTVPKPNSTQTSSNSRIFFKLSFLIYIRIISMNFQNISLGPFWKNAFLVFFWPKNPFWGPILVPEVTFWGVLGASFYWKVVLEFWFGGPKCHFWYPQNGCFFSQNPQKATSGTKIGPQKCFLAKKTQKMRVFFSKISPRKVLIFWETIHL